MSAHSGAVSSGFSGNLSDSVDYVRVEESVDEMKEESDEQLASEEENGSEEHEEPEDEEEDREYVEEEKEEFKESNLISSALSDKSNSAIAAANANSQAPNSTSASASTSSAAPKVSASAAAVAAASELDKKKLAWEATFALSREKVSNAKSDSTGKVFRVYCDGVFDLFHIGHMKMLEQAKKSLGDASKVHLICGVCSDELVHRYKGKTVMNHEIRCESAKHCKWVDQVAEDAPWVITDDFIAKYQIDFVAHDALPYKDNSGGSADSADVYAYIKSKGMFLETKRTEGISTSDLILAIVRDYDEYVQRQLDRGYTKKELNVGRSWALRMKLHEGQKKIKEKMKKTEGEWKDVREEIRQFIKAFDPKHTLLQRSPSRSQIILTPGKYVRQISTEAKAHGEGIIFHSIGLTKAIFWTGVTILTYVNPFSYYNPCKRKPKEKSS